ncbi:uncharacterized protein M421DRAFT_421836 [Didymella exigua CBS 183.55]|uniref:Uncharacterized protein n=1 Tax=Didymella exigua CBS 183.55 TaxID=1150837 RepID=A0A6A5RJZ4_9PLEO|nr:uncharacterized protein M421DRAFT_421836 [Didymella exigua CBS 183.55]KAF1927428.1 hypothetical protein M421DRAFT_421836 [Didymella exigua CBS 183.55]
MGHARHLLCGCSASADSSNSHAQLAAPYTRWKAELTVHCCRWKSVAGFSDASETTSTMLPFAQPDSAVSGYHFVTSSGLVNLI